MKNLLYILGLILLLISGCKKESGVTSEVLYYDKAYNHYKFQVQSYWIYENESTLVTDSLNLVAVDSGFYWNPPPVHGTQGTQREFYKMRMVSSSNSYEYIDFIDSYGIRRNPSGEWYICGRIIYSVINQSNFEHIDSLSVNGTVFTILQNANRSN